MSIKRKFVSVAVLLVFQLIYADAESEPDIVSSENWTHHTILDGRGKYHLYWRPPSDKKGNSEITFKVEVRTRGYVGFGLSPNGGMAGSDIVTGWIKDGKVFFQDRHAVGEDTPIVDKIQNWKLISGFENDTFTVLTFSRKLDTCDEEEDMVIDDSTMRLIFAYSDEDPPGEHPRYHGAKKRGSKSVMLLQSKIKSNQDIDLSTLLHWDIRSPDIDISSRDTLYWCKIYRSPRLSKKHHIVHVKPLIQEGHEQFVHHMLLFECVGGDLDEYESYVDYRGHVCHHPNMPKPMQKCEGLSIAWAIGGEDLLLPEHVGLPLYADPGSYFKLEIHYDNPQLQSGIVDHSGLRIYYTPDLRKFDAGSLGLGATASPLVIVPPGREKYVVAGHSNPDCLAPAFPKGGIKALGVLLNAHLAARKVIARHFRGKEELVPLAEDKNYDFNYQEYRYFREEVRIQKKDRITVECTYDTSKRKNVTLGGLPSTDEMCLALMLYYPRINRYGSLSNPRLERINHLLKTNFTFTPENHVVYVEMKRTLSRYDWTKVNIDIFEKAMRNSQHKTICYFGNGEKNGVASNTTYPRNFKAFTRESTCKVSSLENNLLPTDNLEYLTQSVNMSGSIPRE